MNSFSLNLHTARRIRMRRRCLNGTWQLQITVDTETDRQDLTIFAGTREALDFELADDQHCRITGGESTVEYSATPFGDSPSSDGSAKR